MKQEENQRCVVCEPMRRVSGRREGSAEGVTAGNLDLVTWKLLEILGKVVPLDVLGMKTRLVRVEKKMVDEEAKTGNLDKSFKEFCLTGGQRKEAGSGEKQKKSKEDLSGF